MQIVAVVVLVATIGILTGVERTAYRIVNGKIDGLHETHRDERTRNSGVERS